MEELDQYKSTLRTILEETDGIEEVLNKLTKELQLNNTKRDLVVGLRGRLNRLIEKQIMGILDSIDLERLNNQLRFDVLNLINSFTSKDFSPSSPSESETNEALAPGRTEVIKQIFISYAHKDSSYKEEMETHLASLKRTNRIRLWHDLEIQAGTEWDESIQTAIRKADIILLLISADFINSQYIWKNELDLAMARHARKEVKIIPIFVRPSDWEDLGFSKILGLPRNGVPISKWEDRDEAWLNVVKDLKRVIDA